ncbi:unnamed protein product [Ectocarpus sp. CCAP 1310/34]|nr:unnamed protein product [Ectocarpus sp. CCAP 1310/34]
MILEFMGITKFEISCYISSCRNRKNWALYPKFPSFARDIAFIRRPKNHPKNIDCEAKSRIKATPAGRLQRGPSPAGGPMVAAALVPRRSHVVAAAPRPRGFAAGPVYCSDAVFRILAGFASTQP